MLASNNAKYALLARDLIEAIDKGTYPVGTLLPTELQLSQLYGFSRQTVRQALLHLAGLGLILRQAGVGTRVERRHAGTNYTYAVNSFADLQEYARELHLRVDSVKKIAANGDLADLIGCREGSGWIRVQGCRFADCEAKPVAFSESYFHSAFTDIKKHVNSLGDTSMHMMLEREYGETIEEIQQQIVAVALDAEVAHALHEEPATVGLEIRRRFYGKGRRLVLAGRVVHAGSRFTYGSRFLRGSTT
jgi:GntR family transcriptional regulator